MVLDTNKSNLLRGTDNYLSAASLKGLYLPSISTHKHKRGYHKSCPWKKITKCKNIKLSYSAQNMCVAENKTVLSFLKIHDSVESLVCIEEDTS